VVAQQYVYIVGGFYPKSFGRQAIEQVDVYFLNGTQKEDSNVTSMITPRGCLSTIVIDNRFVLAAGGVTSIDSNPLSIIEVLDTQTGEWSSSSVNLTSGCTNPQLGLFGAGSVAAICAESMTVSVLNITTGSAYNLSSLPQPACSGGVVGAIEQTNNSGASYDDDTLLVYFCSEGTFLLDSNTGWTVTNNPFQWQSIPVQYPISVINAELSMFSSNSAIPFFVFTIANNSLNFNPYVVVDYCSGKLLYGDDQFVCVEGANSARKSEAKTSSKGDDEEAMDKQSVYESSWSMLFGNAQRSAQGLGKWDFYPLNGTEAL